MTARVKICGITAREDALAAQACGADYIGCIVDIREAHRSVSIQLAVEIISGLPSAVLLMEGPPARIEDAVHRIRPRAVQLIGPFADEELRHLRSATAVELWKTVNIPRSGYSADESIEHTIVGLHQSGIDAIVLDTLVPGRKGGTGHTCDWNTAARIVQSVTLPVFLAGGLNPDNVAAAVAGVRPFGVDVSSGVECSPGTKDTEKISLFIQRATHA